MNRYSCLDSIADHGCTDRPLVAPDLGLGKPPDADLGDRAGGEGGQQEGGLLDQEQMQEHAGKAEGHQDLRRTEDTLGVSKKSGMCVEQRCICMYVSSIAIDSRHGFDLDEDYSWQ